MDNNIIQAAPTKAFFVEMLTKDIELEDAILDLLDNCIDGVHRSHQRKYGDIEIDYAQYFAEITITNDYFEIKDNCGGIPLTIARNYAFRMGRPKQETGDESLYTIGTYGIGMKRSIFKMGGSACVTSIHDDDAYRVFFTPEWLAQDNNWELRFEELNPAQQEIGTTIRVEQLHPAIANSFGEEGKLITGILKRKISEYYSFILKKGFSVYLNGKKVSAKEIKLLLDQPSLKQKDSTAITPYLYRNTKDEVEIELAIGFYRGTATEDELEPGVKSRKRSSEEAGITIVCNDRVVVYCDKTRLTGWGEAKVPNYHPQYIAITGIVHFKSKNARLLPLNTTKRGLDISSDLYLYTKDFIREGLKIFTNYTNKWKRKTTEESKVVKTAKLRPLNKIFDTVTKSAPDKWTKVRGKSTKEVKYVPTLPTPPSTAEPEQYLRFAKPEAEIKLVAQYLFEDENKSPSQVGEACFDYVYDLANEENTEEE